MFCLVCWFCLVICFVLYSGFMFGFWYFGFLWVAWFGVGFGFGFGCLGWLALCLLGLALSFSGLL